MTRITQSMLSTNMLRNLNTSYSKMSRYQDMLTSGMKITRASDDPVVAVKGMEYRVQLDKISQFQRNINESEAWLDTTDTSLDQVGNVLNRVKELVVQAANDTNTADDRAKIKMEIDQIREQVKDVANTQLGGKFIFSGTHTQKSAYTKVEVPDIKTAFNSLSDADKTAVLALPEADMLAGIQNRVNPMPMATVRVENTDAGLAAPYASEVFSVTDPADPTKQVAFPSIELPITIPPGTESMSNAGLNGKVELEVFDGIQLTVNTNGALDMFASIEKSLKQVSDVLANPASVGKEIGDLLGPNGLNAEETIAKLQANVLDIRADVGARMNRVELMKNRLDVQQVNVTKQKSLNEDVDYAETITHMATQESIHQAALSVGAKIIQQTLVDFIR